MGNISDEELDSRLTKVLSNVFGIAPSLINENSSPDNVDSWDSLRQMTLIMALEEEFSLVLSDDQIVEMLNYKLIRQILKESVGG